MPALNSKKSTTKKAPTSVSELVVRRSKRKAKAAPMLTEDIVPAGQYRSKIIAVTDAKTDEGKLMADITYRFTDTRGQEVDARIRYPVAGYHIERLYDALIDAGLPDESPLIDAVGIVEKVEIVYPFEGALGKIKDRRPATVTAQPKSKVQKEKKPRAEAFADEIEDEVDDDDEEFEDFLEDDDS